MLLVQRTFQYKHRVILIYMENEKVKTHEWRRYFARIIDISLLSIPIGMLLKVFPPNIFSENNIVIFMISIFIWIFIESLLLSTWGTTPGKFLYRIDLQGQDGESITFSRALSRSFAVWFRGLGCGFPLITGITMIIADWKLTRKGITSWDKDGGFTITHNKINFLGWITILLVIGLIFLSTSLSEIIATLEHLSIVFI